MKNLFLALISFLVGFTILTIELSKLATPIQANSKEWICHNGESVWDQKNDHGHYVWRIRHFVWDWKNGHNDYFGRCQPTASPSPSASPSATPSATPEATPSPTPEAKTCANGATGIDGHECGWTPPMYNPEYKAPVCTVALPVAVTPTYDAISGTVVKLTWIADDTNTTHWSISYGYDKDNLPMGTGELPKEAREYTVLGLDPTQTKWFELARWNGPSCAVYGSRIDP